MCRNGMTSKSLHVYLPYEEQEGTIGHEEAYTQGMKLDRKQPKPNMGETLGVLEPFYWQLLEKLLEESQDIAVIL